MPVRGWALPLALPLLAACATQAQVSRIQDAQDGLARFAAAARDSLDCRTAAAGNPRYRILNAHMPLVDIGTATLAQLSDRSLATDDEILVLAAWMRELTACRQALLEVTESTVPGFGPIIEASSDDDDTVFVALAQRRMPWGAAVMKLKRIRTKLRGDVIARADQVLAEVGQIQQAQLNRRATVLSSVIRILP